MKKPEPLSVKHRALTKLEMAPEVQTIIYILPLLHRSDEFPLEQQSLCWPPVFLFYLRASVFGVLGALVPAFAAVRERRLQVQQHWDQTLAKEHRPNQRSV